MMYLIFKSDGSIKTKKLNEFIQQGNNYENVFFVAIEEKQPSAYNLVANFILPNDRTQEVVSLSDEGEEEIEGVTYYGRYLSIVAAQTLLSGTLQVNISAIDRVTDKVLVSSRVYLTVNEGTAPGDPVIMTHAEYENLVSIIGKNILISETILKAEVKAQILPLSQWNPLQTFLIKHYADGSITNHKVLAQVIEVEGVKTLDILVDFDKLVHKTGDEVINGKKTFNDGIKSNRIEMGFADNDYDIYASYGRSQGGVHGNGSTFSVTKKLSATLGHVLFDATRYDNGFVEMTIANIKMSGEISDNSGNKVTVANIVKKDTENVFTYIPKTSANRSYTSDRQLTDVQYVTSAISTLNTALSGRIDDLEEEHTVIGSRITTIENKIPTQASPTNQLADKDWVNSTINSLAAFYITKNAQGDPFETKAELLAATVFYSGGQVRIPTRNDYCLVRADETHDDASCRYIYQGNQWEFQFVVNETPFTEAQVKAINSGITQELVAQITTNKNDIESLEEEKLDVTEAEETYQKKDTVLDLTIPADAWDEETRQAEIDITQETIGVGLDSVCLPTPIEEEDEIYMTLGRVKLAQIYTRRTPRQVKAIFKCLQVPTEDISVRLLFLEREATE